MEPTRRRAKLGLALAGGGFRASLFHLGVFRRMAELDLLRYVEVMSTVSGGSIIGALYTLLLKLRLEKSASARLEPAEYVRLVEDLERILLAAIRRNLRTRLFFNPFTLLRTLVTQYTLGAAMGRLYERHIYRSVLEDPEFRRQGKARRAGALLLQDIRVRPGGTELPAGIEAYNRQATTSSPPGSAVTNHVLNATSLNSGARFWFASSEVGDWYLGHVRHSEIHTLLFRKRLVALSAADFEQDAARAAKEAEAEQAKTGGEDEKDEEKKKTGLGPGTFPFARWWRNGLTLDPENVPEYWRPLLLDDAGAALLRRLIGPQTSLGQLRLAKLPAWYALKGINLKPPVLGGTDGEGHLGRFRTALEAIDDHLSEAYFNRTPAPPEHLLPEFVLELYWFRSAERISPRVERFWNTVTLGDAVAASACFPPVFAPLVLHRVYDDWHVSRLAVSDGGVYDNIGLTALLDEQCTHIIASDTSGLLGVAERAATGRVGMMARITGVLMEAVAERERDQLRGGRHTNEEVGVLERALGPAGGPIAGDSQAETAWRELRSRHPLDALAFFHIKSPQIGDGLRLDIDPEDLARIRTDLDGFGEVEVDALVNHGYNMADRYLRKYFKDTPYCQKSPVPWTAPQVPPRPLEPTDRARKIIRVGRLRFFRALMLLSPISMAITVLLVGGLVWATWGVRLTLSGIFTWLAAHLPWGGDRHVSLGLAILLLVLAAAVPMFWPTLVEHVARGRSKRYTGKLAVFGRVARGYVGNLLWPFGLLPLVLALLGTLAALISHLCYYLPFRRSSRNPARE